MPDIQLPLQPQEPPIQSVSHTALGRVEEALAAGGDALSEEDFMELVAEFKVLAEQKGIQLN